MTRNEFISESERDAYYKEFRRVPKPKEIVEKMKSWGFSYINCKNGYTFTFHGKTLSYCLKQLRKMWRYDLDNACTCVYCKEITMGAGGCCIESTMVAIKELCPSYTPEQLSIVNLFLTACEKRDTTTINSISEKYISPLTYSI
jgi:hypothetical protein